MTFRFAISALALAAGIAGATAQPSLFQPSPMTVIEQPAAAPRPSVRVVLPGPTVSKPIAPATADTPPTPAEAASAAAPAPSAALVRAAPVATSEPTPPKPAAVESSSAQAAPVDAAAAPRQAASPVASPAASPAAAPLRAVAASPVAAKAVRPSTAQPAPTAPAIVEAPTARAGMTVGAALAAARHGAPVQRLRHLHNNAQGYRLAGEIGASEWPIYLTEAQATKPLRFRLGYLSAVSVMPEASTLIVQINDVTIGQTAIQAPHAVKTLDFDVPADLVKPGFNSLRIAVQQRHRVDCSLQATYELWTQIDPSQTGFLFAADDPGVVSVADLPALSPNPQGGMPVRAIIAEQTDFGSVDRMLRAVQAISINGRFEQVLVDVDAGVAADPYGVNLAVGPWLQLRQVPGLQGLRQPEGPTLTVLPARDGGRTTIVATGNTREEVDAALERLAGDAALRGSGPGLRAAAAFPGYRIDGGQRVKIKDLGVVSQEFSGRMFRLGMQILMPSDFYAADYGKVQINLAGGYSAGLTPDAQIIVSVNGRNVVGVKLPKTGGEVFRDRSIPLPLSALRPGLNRIDIEAHVPTKADKVCDPLASMGREQRFLLLDSTELVVPDIARIARMPDLAVTATGAFPYADGRIARLYVPRPDRETIAAAATVIARLAVSGGRSIDFRLTTAPPAGDAATLVVGAAPSIDPAVLAMLGLDAELMHAAWKEWSEDGFTGLRDATSSRFETLARYNLALQRNFPAECRMRQPFARRVAQVDEAPKPKGTEALFDSWRQTQRDNSQVYAFGRASIEWFGERLRIFRRIAAGVVRRLAPEQFDDDQSRIVRPNVAMLMSQASVHGDASGVWTLVTAPSPTALAETAGCAVDPRVWAQVRGRIAALDSNEAQVSALRASGLEFVGTQPLSVQNARLIAAGWFSTNRWTYAGMVLFLAVLLGSSTFWLVRNIGRRQP